MITFKAIIIGERLEEVQLLRHIIAQQCPHVVISETGSTAAQAKHIIENIAYDIIILGFESGMNYAFQMLQNAAQNLSRKKLILMASKQQQQLQYITNTTVDVIARPITPVNMVLALKNATENMKHPLITHKEPSGNHKVAKPLNVIAIPSVHEVKILKVSDILYLQSEGKYTVFHTVKDSTILSSTNLGEYEKKLTHNNFFRAHNSFLINIDNIVNIQKKDGVYVEMNNRAYIPVAKRKKESLFHYLGNK